METSGNIRVTTLEAAVQPRCWSRELRHCRPDFYQSCIALHLDTNAPSNIVLVYVHLHSGHTDVAQSPISSDLCSSCRRARSRPFRRRELYRVASNVAAERSDATRTFHVAHAQREAIRAIAGARPLSDDDMLRSQPTAAPTKSRHSELNLPRFKDDSDWSRLSWPWEAKMRAAVRLPAAMRLVRFTAMLLRRWKMQSSTSVRCAILQITCKQL